MTERCSKLSTFIVATVLGISFSFPIAEDFHISACPLVFITPFEKLILALTFP